MSDVTPIRDPKNDALLTPQNAVIAFIDYQPEQYAGVGSVRHDELLAHVTMLGRVATTFELPVVLSTVYVRHGMGGTNAELREALPGVPEIDRTTMNSWEDPEFRAAVERSGRKKLIIGGSGPKSAWRSRRWMRSAQVTRCGSSPMRSAGSAKWRTSRRSSA